MIPGSGDVLAREDLALATALPWLNSEIYEIMGGLFYSEKEICCFFFFKRWTAYWAWVCCLCHKSCWFTIIGPWRETPQEKATACVNKIQGCRSWKGTVHLPYVQGYPRFDSRTIADWSTSTAWQSATGCCRSESNSRKIVTFHRKRPFDRNDLQRPNHICWTIAFSQGNHSRVESASEWMFSVLTRWLKRRFRSIEQILIGSCFIAFQTRTVTLKNLSRDNLPVRVPLQIDDFDHSWQHRFRRSNSFLK